MRVISHPILGEEKETEWVTIYVNGKPIQAKKGEMIAQASLPFAQGESPRVPANTAEGISLEQRQRAGSTRRPTAFHMLKFQYPVHGKFRRIKIT